MKIKSKYFLYLFVFLVFLVLFFSCEDNYIPKPKGYFRIDMPPHSYKVFDTIFPYKFEYSKYAKYKVYNKDSAWINIIYPKFKAIIHITYKNPSTENLDKILDETQTLAYKHTLKADAIDETNIIDTINNIYGLMYYMEGNSASNIQFYITDSTRHFFRGALYFDVRPNYDSLRPVISYMKEDIKHLISSMRWK